MTEQEKRELVIATGIRMLDENLVQGTWGNISIRLDDSHMLCTPSGLDYKDLKPEDIPVVDINTLEWTGTKKPTSERKLHAAIYRERPNVTAVLHSHPLNCSVVACTKKPVPVISDEMRDLIGGSLQVAKYGIPGTKTMADNTMIALKDRNGALLAHHGAISCGDDMEQAYQTLRCMEDSSRDYVMQSAMEELGETTPSKDLTKKVFLKRFNG